MAEHSATPPRRHTHMQYLQNYPRLLERLYDATYRLIKPFRRWLKPNGRLEPILIRMEKLSKGAIFDCRMCGQCILHSAGMTCPMTCPKKLRNGPCGGVRVNGNCEVIPEMRCVWVQAFERARKMPHYGSEMMTIQPPVNQQLEGSSSWINMLAGVDMAVPNGWILPAEIPILTWPPQAEV